MGRPNVINNENTNAKFYLERLEFIDYCYDKGGAYWGMPANLYRAISGNHADNKQEMFIRAANRNEAKTKVLAILPNARFYR